MRKHQILSTLLLVLCIGLVSGQQLQKKTSNNTAKVKDTRHLMLSDTTPVRHENKFLIDRTSIATRRLNNAPVDSVASLDNYIQMKANCEVKKYMDDDGSILIRYPDGYTRKFSNGIIVEVITADGVRHVPKKGSYIPHIALAVIQIPPPVPGINDPVYKWLAKFRADLENDIREAIGGGDDRWKLFLSDESDACGNNIYKQIQFRTSFLENYGKAK